MLEGFVLTVLGVALGIILAVVGLIAIMFNEKVLKWYTKKSKKMTAIMIEDMFKEE